MGPCWPRRWHRIVLLNDALAVVVREAPHLVTNATTVASWKRTAIAIAEVDSVIACAASAAPSASTIAAAVVVGLQRA